ncbi:MAG: M48 family metalloprotease [Gemmatimonadetes bacterium]|nr:M48 family metalloprotease [Gemmatimonadota bacterium]
MQPGLRFAYARVPDAHTFLAVLLLGGSVACASAGDRGPSTASTAEGERIRRIRHGLELIEHQKRVDIVVENLIRALPGGSGPDSALYGGVHVADFGGTHGRQLAEAIGLRHAARPFVYGIDPVGPAAESGLERGDQILTLAGRAVRRAQDFNDALGDLSEESDLTLEVLRRDRRQSFTLPRRYRPRDLTLVLVADGRVINAFANRHGILLTTGMLQFLRGADELAVVLGHEVAHLVRGHLSGSYVGFGFNPAFSRDLEREADRYGLELAHKAGYDAGAGLDIWQRFASEIPAAFHHHQGAHETHPTSGERRLLARKVVERLGPPLRPHGSGR